MKDYHGGDVKGKAKRAGINPPLNPDDVVDFSASLSPIGPPESAIGAAKSALASASAPYPDPGADRLREAICDRYGVDSGTVLPANGSTELIYLVPQALRPRSALIVGPAFSEYAVSLDAWGCSVEYFMAAEEDDFVPDMAALSRRVGDGFDLVYLANPSNPAGAAVKRTDVLRLAKKCSDAGAVLVVDEAFVDFAPEYSVIKEAAETDGLIVLRSLTKYYALAGLRLGFMAACKDLIDKFARVKPPWSVNTPAMAAGEAALGDTEFDRETGRWLGPERARLAEGIGAIEGLKVFPSAANYLLVKILKGDVSAGELQEVLLKGALLKETGRRPLLIRDLTFMRGLGDTFFRVAVLGRDDNDMLVRGLAAVMEMKKVGTKNSKTRCAR